MAYKFLFRLNLTFYTSEKVLSNYWDPICSNFLISSRFSAVSENSPTLITYQAMFQFLNRFCHSTDFSCDMVCYVYKGVKIDFLVNINYSRIEVENYGQTHLLYFLLPMILGPSSNYKVLKCLCVCLFVIKNPDFPESVFEWSEKQGERSEHVPCSG